jgi:hypothetical protein
VTATVAITPNDAAIPAVNTTAASTAEKQSIFYHLKLLTYNKNAFFMYCS